MPLDDGNAPAAATAPETTPASAPATTPAAPTAPAATPSLGQRLEAATGTIPDPAATTAPAPTDASWQGVRDFAKAQGVDLPYEDDGAALSALLQAHRSLQQRNYYADLGQRIAPYAGQVQEFLTARRQQQAAPAAQPWAAPEFNKAWLQQVERDETTGQLRSRAGYDPAIADKVTAYAEWRDKFLDNPEQVVAPLIESRAKQLIDQRFAEFQQRSQADQLVAAHAPWMFAPAANGQRQLTPEGLLYAQACRGLWDSGLRDVRVLDASATAYVENMVLRRRLAANGAGNGAAPPPLALATTAPTSIGGGAVRPAAGLPAAPASTKGLSLREALTKRLNGFPEDVSLGA